MELLTKEMERARRIRNSYITKVRFCENVLMKRDFNKWDIVTLRDISSTGLLFNYDQRIPINSKIEFKIMMPFSEIIYCYGRVCRIEGVGILQKNTIKNSVFGIGVKFTTIENYQQKLLDRFAEKIKDLDLMFEDNF